jgi:hypothetical protein
MTTLAVGSQNVMQRIRRMMAAMATSRRFVNETRYQPPQIWRHGMRLQPSLRYANPSTRAAQDEGRPKEMSGRQWKRLKKAEHLLGRHQQLLSSIPGGIIREAFLDGRPIKSAKDAWRANAEFHKGEEARRRIHMAHASCDRPKPGHPFRGSRRLRTLIEL